MRAPVGFFCLTGEMSDLFESAFYLYLFLLSISLIVQERWGFITDNDRVRRKTETECPNKTEPSRTLNQ